MPERVRDLVTFLDEIKTLLQLLLRCQEVLFRRRFRDNLTAGIEDALGQLSPWLEHAYVRTPGEFPAMISAGLAGPQLELKLESFETALVAFEETAGHHHLEEALDAGAKILNSLAGAIPGFGSFASEIVDFLLKELKKRFRWWRS